MSTNPYLQRVKDVMIKDVVYVHPQDTLDEALALLVENRVSGMPVVDGRHRCVGVLSVTDLIDLARELDEEISDLVRVSEISRGWLVEKLTQRGLGKQKVQEVMTPVAVGVAPVTLLAEAAQMMIRNRVHRLVVMDTEQRLLGIIAAMDILGAFAAGAAE
jgi:CBS domain-containing protein